MQVWTILCQFWLISQKFIYWNWPIFATLYVNWLEKTLKIEKNENLIFITNSMH